MEKVRIIKKYPDRRLYDTGSSQYTTLDEIKLLVLKHVKFKVIEASTKEDVTSYMLLQIINENEAKRMPIFTTEILQNIIRFYGNPLQTMMSEFLENCFAAVVEEKMDFGNYFQNIVEKDHPFNKLADIAKKNLAMWQSMQKTTADDDTDKKAKASSKTKSKRATHTKRGNPT